MGKVKRPKERRPRKRRLRKWFDNLSLKTCFMAYMVFFLIMGAILSVVSMMYFAGAPHEYLTREYEVFLNQEDMNYYRVDDNMIAIYYESDAALPDGRVNGMRMTRTEYVELTEADELFLVLMDWGMGLSIPFWLIVCVVSAGLLFYRNRLKRPIENLTQAHAKVAANDLDFTLPIIRDDELGKLCASFEAMRQALVQNNLRMWRAMEEQKRLRAAFSHDLRTPLTVLSGYTEMLRKYNPAPDKQREMLDAISSHVGRMSQYVADMNAVQKLEDIEPKYERVALRQLTDAMIDEARLLLREKHLSFAGVGVREGAIYADQGMIHQVFDNLIANAARFAASKVTLSFVQRDQVFSVVLFNDGAPFDETQLQKAAEPYFTSGDDESGVHFGLGLYIAETLARKHGGSLVLSNPESGGALVAANFFARRADP